MRRSFLQRHCDCEAELEWHVESWASESAGSGEFDPGEIVQRERTLPDDSQKARQSIVTGWNLQNASGVQSQTYEPRDRGKKDGFVLLVEGSVDEDVGRERLGTWSQGDGASLLVFCSRLG